MVKARIVKVCVVVENHPSAAMGGAQYQGHLLSEELARRAGVTVTYLARGVLPDRCVDAQIPYGVRRIGSRSGIRHRAVLFDAPELWCALHELAPDVVYQQMRQSYTAVCARYARKVKVPFFFHVASDIDLDPRWFNGRISANLTFDVAEAALGLWGMRHASHIIVQTGRQGRILQERFDRAPAAVVRNFQPLPANLPEKSTGPLKVFWVANFKDVKRPELFVELAESFTGRNDLEFIMAGRSSSHRRFTALMKRIERTPNLTYCGELPIDAVNQHMAEADIHVNTSSFEGFPNTFIQAWAQGAVVVSIAVDPDEEGMETLGIGYCAGSFARLRSLIDELTRSREQRQRIATQAFAFVHSKHSLAHGAQLADLILKAARDSSRIDPQRPVFVGG
jgi:glycosyltransferase involved in cell wall biosynthesis